MGLCLTRVEYPPAVSGDTIVCSADGKRSMLWCDLPSTASTPEMWSWSSAKSGGAQPRQRRVSAGARLCSTDFFVTTIQNARTSRCRAVIWPWVYRTVGGRNGLSADFENDISCETKLLRSAFRATSKLPALRPVHWQYDAKARFVHHMLVLIERRTDSAYKPRAGHLRLR